MQKTRKGHPNHQVEEPLTVDGFWGGGDSVLRVWFHTHEYTDNTNAMNIKIIKQNKKG